MIRAVVDANVWVSAFLKPDSNPGRVVDAWRRHQFEAHLASATVVEVARALARPKLVKTYQIRWSQVVRFVGDLVTGGSVHALTAPPRRCRDATDDVLLELAARLSPCLLVTGDGDLLNEGILHSEMKTLGVEILSPVHFMERLAESS